MIEVSWRKTEEVDYDVLKNITNLIAWLVASLADDEVNHSVKLMGYMTMPDVNSRFATLLICDGESQKKILEILQQPPEEYKEKYVACILSEEPQPIQEKDDDSSSDESGEISIDVEKT